MSKTAVKKIEVYAHWRGMLEPALVGILYVTLSRGKEIFAFDYDSFWIKNNQRYLLDPALKWVQGFQYAPLKQDNFGLFLDSSPDRWGRVLMRRREAQLACEEKRSERVLLESDYLLGVYDEHRMGGLRFRIDGPFFDHHKRYASPPWASMRELEHASLELEKDHAENNPNYSRWLALLICPGASLGGARPKASVIDDNHHPWIAKFPSAHDDHDIGAWEQLVTILARKANIEVPETQLRKFSHRYHTFLSKRFDRTAAGERIHFASAMTLLKKQDGDDASTGVSYLELAEFIMQHGSQPDHDLEQLWRRIVFNICVSNVDDHLRNHGFILEEKGWRLSPAFDMNPVPHAYGLKLNISASNNALDLELAQEVAVLFRINQTKADFIINEIKNSVKTWRGEATRLKLSAASQEQTKSAFMHA